MKKWIALMMACLLCGGLFLTGCGKKENPDSWKNEAYDLSLPTLGRMAGIWCLRINLKATDSTRTSNLENNTRESRNLDDLPACHPLGKRR